MLRQNPRGLPLGFRLPILPPALGQLLRQRQRLFHRGGAELLGLGVQVGIDVGRGGNIAVAQPGLDLLHLDAAAQQKAGAAVPRIVKQGRRKAVFLTCAVLAYCGQGVAPAIPPPSPPPSATRSMRSEDETRSGKI